MVEPFLTELAGFDETTRTTYRRPECAVFRKTNADWGEFSNMCAGFPLKVNGSYILTSEHLYQACRFPQLPDVQQEIFNQNSPMSAKMKSKPHRKKARPDFDALRVPIMWWCLRVKLACNMKDFGRLLRASGHKPIVEDSHKDDYWGAVESEDHSDVLEGCNILGRLLVRLRELLVAQGPEAMKVVEPPAVPDFHILGKPVGTVVGS